MLTEKHQTQPSAETPPPAAAATPARARQSVWGFAWKVLRPFLIAFLVIVLAAMWFEETLMFMPSRYPEGDWDPPGLVLEDARFTAADGTRLHGWYVPAERPRATILFCHGNGGNITHRADMLRYLHDQLRVSVLILDYRGYGKSEGRPNEEGAIADARAARSWLARRAGIDESEIVLMGRSMGGAVVVALAAEQPPAGLVLESTFSSMTDVAAHHYPMLPVRWLLRNRFDSLSRIAHYRGPLLATHSRDDEIVPFQFGQRLFDAAPSEDKKFLVFDNLGHNDWNPPTYYDALQQFLDKLPQPTNSP